MTDQLPTDLLWRPAAESARLVALGLLEEAAAAAQRLGNREDSEALHDFRVALRRLRSTLRAYRKDGSGVPKRERRMVKELAARTNAGRDAEVQLAWLRAQTSHLSRRERVGQRWLIQRLEERLEHELTDTIANVRTEFTRAERKLRRRLAHYRPRVPVGGVAEQPPFAAVARAALESGSASLAAALSEIAGAGDAEPVHAARIAAKRLRYTLEPLVASLREGPDLLRLLKRLQDSLGELHDCHVMEAGLVSGAARASADRGRAIYEAAVGEGGRDEARRLSRAGHDVRAGLTALGRLARTRRDSLYKRLADTWFGEAGAGFAARVDGAAAALETPGAAKTRARGRRRGWGRGEVGARIGGRRGGG